MQVTMARQPRYPDILVRCESHNPLALVAAVREAMRLAHVERSEISQFSNEALASKASGDVGQVCRRWVRVASQELN